MPPRQITRILRRAAANYTSVVLSPVNDDAPAANLLADTVYVDRPEHVEITVQRLRRAIGFVPSSIYRGMAPAAALKPGATSQCAQVGVGDSSTGMGSVAVDLDGYGVGHS